MYQQSHNEFQEIPNARHSKTLPRDNEKILFFGREVELKNVTDLIKPTSQTCIISITGSPGFGKSTLAIHAGYRAEYLGYTVVYVDIVEAHDIRLVKQKVIDRINRELNMSLSFNDITDWAGSIKNTTVLILDNCDSALHKQMGDFQSFLRSVCKPSNMLKVIITAKHETLFLGAVLEPIRIKELQSKDAERVLRGTSLRINSTFAQRLAKRVGNVPLALQVVGTLLKDNALSSEELFSQLQKDIIEALSPKELPVEDRVKTSMEVSYRYLPRKFQVCGCILSKLSGIIREHSAHFFLDKLVGIYMSAEPIVWKLKDTEECFSHLVRRSLLTCNRADHDKLCKFHQLVREFFQHILKQRERKIPQKAFAENFLFELAVKEYSLRQYSKVLDATISASPQLVHRFYTEAIKELPNHKRVIPELYLSNRGGLDIDRVFSMRPYQLNALSTLYTNKYFHHSLFNSMLCHTYVFLLNLEMFRSEYLAEFGAVNYFNMYVTNLINLGRLETYEHNSSFALQNLHDKSKFANVSELYHLASNYNSMESHRIYAEYYATLANMYIRLKDFDTFMECWQQLLYLRIFKMKCENHTHRCTSLQRGLAAFGTGSYNLTILYLSSHLYSKLLPLHKRARLFVLVCYSFIKLNQPENMDVLLTYDLTWLDLVTLMETLKPMASTTGYDLTDFHQEFESISYNLFKAPLGVTDDLYLVSKKNSRALLIFGTFLEKLFYSMYTIERKLGIMLQDKATKFVRFYSHLTSHWLYRRRKFEDQPTK